jgi:hypothetical protein
MTTVAVVGGVGSSHGGGCGDYDDDDDDDDDQATTAAARHNTMQEPCTFSFVNDGKTITTTTTTSSHEHEHEHARWSGGLKSLGFAVALAFASGSFATSPVTSGCYFTGYYAGPSSSCCGCGRGCVGDRTTTDWLLVGSLAYQCYFLWTAGGQGVWDLVVHQ